MGSGSGEMLQQVKVLASKSLMTRVWSPRNPCGRNPESCPLAVTHVLGMCMPTLTDIYTHMYLYIQ